MVEGRVRRGRRDICFAVVHGGCFRHYFGPALTRGRPQPVGNLQRRKNAMARPPSPLVACLMQRIVVAVAQRHGELVRNLEAEGPLLGEANMVRLRRPTAAHETGLAGHECEVGLIADALILGNEQRTRRASVRTGGA